ncbi:hypothetical protein [Staphylococcus capitis]|nr:hypothetical protein [Staphylococcus capitis]
MKISKGKMVNIIKRIVEGVKVSMNAGSGGGINGGRVLSNITSYKNLFK